MKNSKIAIAVIAVFAAVSSARAEAGTLENLSGAGDKIAAVDMKKDFGQAGNILDSFFSGSAAKKGSAPVEASVSGSDSAKAGTAVNAYGQTAKDLCNAQPSKMGKLAAEVKPLEKSGLAAGAAGLQKGDSWVDDFNTVVEYVGNVGGDAIEVAQDTGSFFGFVDMTNENNPLTLPGHLLDLYQSATCTD
jgi:hypothetical protein